MLRRLLPVDVETISYICLMAQLLTALSPQALIAVQADHGVFSILEQKSIVALLMFNEWKLIDRQRSHPFSVSRNAAQMAIVIVPIVFPIRWTKAGTLSFISATTFTLVIEL